MRKEKKNFSKKDAFVRDFESREERKEIYSPPSEARLYSGVSDRTPSFPFPPFSGFFFKYNIFGRVISKNK